MGRRKWNLDLLPILVPGRQLRQGGGGLWAVGGQGWAWWSTDVWNKRTVPRGELTWLCKEQAGPQLRVPLNASR